MYISRSIASSIRKRLEKFPVVTITGPRQSGKTTLLKKEFNDFQYYNLERLDHRELIQSDPMGFLESSGTKVIFDEAQRMPELFSYLQVISDERGIPGQYILSGSQSFLMHEKISQSLAGRAFISHLLPFGILELSASDEDIYKKIFNGFYPRLYEQDIPANDFYPSYIQTYIERDIRSLKAIADLNSFSRFTGLCAGRIGQILNLSSLANDAGVSVNTAKSWLSILEASFILYRLQPYHNNFNKRLIKSPKIYFYDTGLACSLLKIQEPEMLRTHYLYGALYENFVLSEISKTYYHAGKTPALYYWRESNGTEIDCIIEVSGQRLMLIEIKGGKTFNKDYIKNLRSFPKSTRIEEKIVLWPGEQSTHLSDIRLVGGEIFLPFLRELKEKTGE